LHTWRGCPGAGVCQTGSPSFGGCGIRKGVRRESRLDQREKLAKAVQSGDKEARTYVDSYETN